MKIKRIFHIHLKKTNEHFYYKTLKLLIENHSDISPCYQHCKLVFSMRDFYESKLCKISTEKLHFRLFDKKDITKTRKKVNTHQFKSLKNN